MTPHPPDGLVLACDMRGRISHVIHDSTGLLGASLVGRPLHSLVERPMRPKLGRFFRETRHKGATLAWELTVQLGKRPEVMNFFGLVRDGQIYVIISQSPNNIFFLYDEMLGIINDQAAQLRTLQQQARAIPSVSDSVALDEFMKVNNDLVNLQRELHISHARLARQETRFHKMIQEHPDCIFVLDDASRLLYCNAAASALLAVVPGEASGNAACPLFACKGQGEIELRDTGGAVRMLELRHADTTWDDKPARLVSMRDITERRQVEALKEDMDRISRHDLKTPLNGIIGLPTILLMDDNLTPEQREYISLIRDSGYRMLDLINISLHLFQMETGRYTPRLVPVELVQVLRKVLVDIVGQFQRQPEQMVSELLLDGRPAGPEDAFWVLGEELLCHSMFSNLLRNAFEASSPGATVRLLLESGDWCTVRIENAGEVPPDFQPRFFDKYATQGKQGGTGLGTYSARLMARTLGGELELDLSRPGLVAVVARLPCPSQEGYRVIPRGEYPRREEQA
ncbi:sensor histidine kinase [Megalodesulfovibrio gigas]|uniref:histidine kinase n=1 Tax=Megalodesulfovibrio gigas (strain ATCC 19364 / DSM 1382 / NCIMB 9332 / VKM B-1759) TaxID=1121448 RepID=T2GCM4_MEGG1|nr:HAMP domain-containing sensor histidine kinase [Megalodesulfovibrio gigas]AGW14330.1 putative response regulator receiver sensor signal transduction histidine kinase [Megalodesulfovibrio gigas DSM 1382 = ATCC 19364]